MLAYIKVWYAYKECSRKQKANFNFNILIKPFSDLLPTSNLFCSLIVFDYGNMNNNLKFVIQWDYNLVN